MKKQQQLKQDQINWKKIKLVGDGSEGLELSYAYIKEIKGRGFIKSHTLMSDIPPHDDLLNLFKELRPIVATIESVDYARKLPALPGFDATDNQLILIENLTQNIMKSIEVTGIHLSERRKDKGLIISYKKYDIQEQSTGHTTTWIGLSGNEYAIEEDLQEILNEIISESFKYEFEEKYADFEQLAIDYDVAEEVEETITKEVE